MPDREAVETAVQEFYAAAARDASACCEGPTEALPYRTSVWGAGRYGADELNALPAAAVSASIGCANPVAIADLLPGEVVLDLGSGGGIDVLLSARRVGPTGRAYGLDRTDEMLELARANQRAAGVSNVEFLRGHIEEIPLPSDSVDVVISNCVINLSADKEAVFAEVNRVLRPGGRLAVADVVANVDLDEARRADLAAWTACLAGAVTRAVYRTQLERAGFADVHIIESHPVADQLASVVVRANKPTLPAER